MPNRLAQESSPYLRQHAENPVDWYPWGDEAFERARSEDKPIFLSVGYSACHWCHVMERESFENEETADLLNERFVSVKVDREERPDVDAVYMDAVQALTGRGGWPMSVFLTPDGDPFFGGTYFPDTARFGMPSFRQVLEHVSRLWETERDDVRGVGRDLAEALQDESFAAPGAPVPPEHRVLDRATAELFAGFDELHGGWRPAPKFPQPPLLRFALRRYTGTRDERLLHLVRRTLDGMMRGGIRDHLGGGFHRYSTDEKWLVPHFEKMLYDNAQLALLYTHAWQVTREPEYRHVAEETLDYISRQLIDPEGGFHSSQDADTEGEEGRFFVWTPDEIHGVIARRSTQPERDAHLFLAAYGVSDRGNFEGRTVLSLKHTPAELAQVERSSEQDVAARLSAVRGWLLAEREKRARPGLDDKVLASWNGLALSAFAVAARVFGREDYRRIAERNGAFLLSDLRRDDGRLLHAWHSGRAGLNGYLEDHALVAAGLLELYQTTFEEGWFVAARELCDIVLEHFTDPAGGFFDTSDDHERLFMRPKNLQDLALPSAGSAAAEALIKIAEYTGEERYALAAERALVQASQAMTAAPHSFANWLSVLDLVLAPPQAVAIVGSDAKRFTRLVWSEYRPHTVVAATEHGQERPHVPLLRQRDPGEGATCAYLCRDGACGRPACSVEELEEALGPTNVAVGLGV